LAVIVCVFVDSTVTVDVVVVVTVTTGVASEATVEVTVTVCVTVGVVQAADNKTPTTRTENISRFIFPTIPCVYANKMAPITP
jgi:hypothetical protein